MSFYYFSHFVVATFLFFIIAVTFFRTDIAKKPIAGVDSFNWLSHKFI
jgi:hypothetical protein